MAPDLAARVYAFVQTRRLVGPGRSILAGVSGGPDSVALLHLLIELSSRFSLDWSIRAAHLHHGIRGAEADEDAEFVAALCSRLGVACMVGHADVPALAAASGKGIEAAAREARYRFLRETAETLGCGVVAVGHQKDDVAETLVMRLARGAGLWGLGAVPPVRPLEPGSAVLLVRPLLTLRRAEIEDWLRARGIPWRTDAANADPAYERTRIRRMVMPALEGTLGTGVVEELARINDEALELRADLDRRTQAAWEAIRTEDRPPALVLIPWPAWEPLDAMERKWLLRRAVARALADASAALPLHRAQYDAVAGLDAETAVGREVGLGNDLRLRAEHDGLTIVSRAPGRSAPAATIRFDLGEREKEHLLPGFGLRLRMRLIDAVPDPEAFARNEGGPWTAVLDADALQGTLSVRCRRPGDRFRPLGAPGARRLKEFLIDEKLPVRLRDRTPLLLDGSGEIVWVIGLRLGHRARCTPATHRILLIEADRRAPAEEQSD